MSRRPDGRRGRRKPDPAEETASWLLEIEQAGQSDEEEDDWSGTLRATRREATGQFPPVPSEGPARARPAGPAATPTPPGHRAPPAGRPGNWFSSERRGQPSGQGTGNWGATPAPPARGGAEPPPEPQAWETQPEAEPWNGRWPFEETSQSWEPDDRSYNWPAQELPSTTGGWDVEAAPAPSDPWATPGSGGYVAPTGSEAAGYQAPPPPADAYADPGFGSDPPGGYTSPGGYDRAGYDQTTGYSPAGDYPPPGDYPSHGGYETTGHQAANGFETAGYDGTGGYASTAPYDAVSGSSQAGDPYATGGHDASGDPYATGGHDASGDPYATGNPYAPGRDPFAAEDQYAHDLPYGVGGGYGGQDPGGYGSRDAGGTTDPGQAGEPRQAADPYAPREPYPGHDPFAAYGLQGSRRPHGPGAGQPAGGSASSTSFDQDRSSGPIHTGSATGEIWPPVPPGTPGPAAPPPRPESWPAQTGTWGIDEPSPRPRPAATGEFSRVLENDEEQVVRLGRGLDDQGGTGPLGPNPRVQPARSSRSGEARLLDKDQAGHRARWPRVVALISWIILLMVLCWFYVFPWLEKILPENF